MVKLLNPRGYLSWSQVDLFKRNRKLYIERYIHGAGEEKNERMDFGSRLAQAEETGEETDDELTDLAVRILPTYKVKEYELMVPFKTPSGEVKLLGKMDTFDPDKIRFREHKTGTTSWTQRRADNHKQLDHYAALIWIKHKTMPSDIHLDWVETEMLPNGTIRLTGKIETFQVKKTLADVLKYLAEVSSVAKEIDKIYREELDKLIK